MVTNTDEETAGSCPARSSTTGTTTPERPGDQDVDQHRRGDHPAELRVGEDQAGAEAEQDRDGDAVQQRDRDLAPDRPQVLERVSWFIASARTDTAMVWVPALPPIEATIGISTASATISSIAAPNR